MEAAVPAQGFPALRLSYELHAPPLAAHPARVDSSGVAMVLAGALLIVVVSRACRGAKHLAARHASTRALAPASVPPASAPPREPARRQSARKRAARSATLEELSEVSVSLSWLVTRPFDAEQLLLKHLKRFSHTSPWVLLELRELRERCAPSTEEQRALEDAEFIARFGVHAPPYRVPRSESGVGDDRQLSTQLVRSWPATARQCITHWMLGSPSGKRPSTGMPVLDLQVYRDLLFLHGVLEQRRLSDVLEAGDFFSETVARDAVDPKRARSVDLELA